MKTAPSKSTGSPAENNSPDRDDCDDRVVDPASAAGPPGWIDSRQFAEQGAVKSGATATPLLKRLDSSLDGEPGIVNWRFEGRLDRMADSSVQRWLSLVVNLHAQMTCARCDEPADMAVAFERSFLLVADEKQAARLDDEAEAYDVLVGERRFSLTDLLEDECLMSLPSFVSHLDCQPMVAEVEAEPPRNPFAVLAALRKTAK